MLRIFLALLFVLSWVVGWGGLLIAKSPLHEIECMLSLLIGTIALVGFGVIDALRRPSV